MVTRVTPEQLEKLRSYGFEGEGELSELIEWLGDDFHGLQNRGSEKWWALGERYDCFSLSPLEATFLLSEALKEGL